MLKKLAPLFQFLPLSLFSTIGFWQQQTSNQGWLLAFQIAALVAVVQLLLIVKHKIVLSRLILSANLYLIFGGLAAFFQQWWYLELYNSLQESAIFIMMLLVGIITTLSSNNGFVGIDKALIKDTAERFTINKKSAYLFIGVLVSLAISVVYKGNITFSVVVPIVFLAILQRYLVHSYSQKTSGNLI
ncbi:MAG: hypothetical protein HRT53_02895 [Colwellia sp.]|nr:hypothetical protein [Colwellia sp.]